MIKKLIKIILRAPATVWNELGVRVVVNFNDRRVGGPAGIVLKDDKYDKYEFSSSLHLHLLRGARMARRLNFKMLICHK